MIHEKRPKGRFFWALLQVCNNRVNFSGSVGSVNEAWHYEFKYRKDGKFLELFER